MIFVVTLINPLFKKSQKATINTGLVYTKLDA